MIYKRQNWKYWNQKIVSISISLVSMSCHQLYEKWSSKYLHRPSNKPWNPLLPKKNVVSLKKVLLCLLLQTWLLPKVFINALPVCLYVCLWLLHCIHNLISVLFRTAAIRSFWVNYFIHKPFVISIIYNSKWLPILIVYYFICK